MSLVSLFIILMHPWWQKTSIYLLKNPTDPIFWVEDCFKASIMRVCLLYYTVQSPLPHLIMDYHHNISCWQVSHTWSSPSGFVDSIPAVTQSTVFLSHANIQRSTQVMNHHSNHPGVSRGFHGENCVIGQTRVDKYRYKPKSVARVCICVLNNEVSAQKYTFD